MGVGSGGRRELFPLWIFIHGTYLVNKKIVLFFGLFLLFFDLFSVVPPSGRGLIVLFSVFFTIFWSFFFRWAPLGNYSADALAFE